jgi:hypothetical protein
MNRSTTEQRRAQKVQNNHPFRRNYPNLTIDTREKELKNKNQILQRITHRLTPEIVNMFIEFVNDFESPEEALAWEKFPERLPGGFSREDGPFSCCTIVVFTKKQLQTT